MSRLESHDDDLMKTISGCIDLEKPKSFFLFAGAGSGKTRAVVETMQMLRDRHGTEFRHSGKKVAVITYTNAACDEIRLRLDFDPIFAVSTIHSFAWAQIRTFNQEISAWLRVSLTDDIKQLCEKQASGRPASRAASERAVQIEAKQRRLQNLDTITQFTYNPNGDNIATDSLSHSEVIAISAAFLETKPLMRQLLIRKHPILIIDESQDTHRELMDVFFKVQAENSDRFSLALFGDTMQRIYTHGKERLEETVPTDWEKPAIETNYRCPKRVVSLLNQIRSKADCVQQRPRANAQEGVVRLFLVHDGGDVDKLSCEREVTKRMAGITSDDEWMNQGAVKVLTLEHHMAARRAAFESFFEPLYKIDRFRTGLLDGTLNGIAFLRQQVLPLVTALRTFDRFAVAQTVKNYSPMMSPETLSTSTNSAERVRKARKAVESLFFLLRDGEDPVLLDVVKAIQGEGLFEIPDVFDPILSVDDEQVDEADTVSALDEVDPNSAIDAWREALAVPFSQFEAYADYIEDKSSFGTHQGIKGLQFPRVMIILDDSEARGWMFSYDKLLGAQDLTSTDVKSQNEGKDSSVDRTRRLFYVTCSRAQESLAVVFYTAEPDRVAEKVFDLGWFQENEVERL